MCTKREFKNTHAYSLKLASAFAKKNKKEFWKDVKKMNPKIKNPISKMNGATDSNNIVNILRKNLNLFLLIITVRLYLEIIIKI